MQGPTCRACNGLDVAEGAHDRFRGLGVQGFGAYSGLGLATYGFRSLYGFGMEPFQTDHPNSDYNLKQPCMTQALRPHNDPTLVTPRNPEQALFGLGVMIYGVQGTTPNPIPCKPTSLLPTTPNPSTAQTPNPQTLNPKLPKP